MAKHTRSKKVVTAPSSPVEMKKFSPRMLLIGAGIALLAFLLVLLSRYLVVATINGAPITRLDYYKELETMSGKQALDNLVTRKLVEQKLTEKNIVISQEVIDAEIQKIAKQLESQGQKLDNVLSTQGLTREYLQRNIVMQKGVEQLLASKSAVSEKEVDAYLAQNETTLPEGMTEKQQREQTRELLKNQIYAARARMA